MCGRFTQAYSWSELHSLLGLLGAPRNLRPRYNVSPTTQVDVIRLSPEGERELVPMRWGLVPRWWSKSLRELPSTINARAETVAAKPMFRDAFRHRRCIIPASGFFEWTGGKGNRQPHYFTAADGSPILAFAGLWEPWRDPETGEDMLSATILVCGANDWMGRFHNRMPVILRPADFASWLDGSMPREALIPAAEDALREWTVDPRVNKAGAGDDDPATIEPAA
jgi:putative SOS response-associated peptidase YedK